MPIFLSRGVCAALIAGPSNRISDRARVRRRPHVGLHCISRSSFLASLVWSGPAWHNRPADARKLPLKTLMAGASPAIATCRAAERGSTMITNFDVDIGRAVELHIRRGGRLFFHLDGG